MSEYTPMMDRLRREYIEMREARFGFSDLYAEEWDRALSAHDAEVRAEGHHVVPCARCGQKPVVVNDALNSDIVVCGDCDVQIGLHELTEVRALVVPEEPEWEYGVKYGLTIDIYAEEDSRALYSEDPDFYTLVRWLRVQEEEEE